MKYVLDKISYKTFETFTVNQLPYRAYFIPFASKEKLFESDVLFERYASDKVTMLSGAWDFAYFSNFSSLADTIDTEMMNFKREEVPFTWQRKGYEPPVYLNSRYPISNFPPNTPLDGPVGVYRKSFNLEKVSKSEIITFLGVAAGGYNIYVNGQSVGYHEGSHNSGEWEISHVLREGVNEILVVLFKWTAAEFIECQDMFRENGIFRDVYLTSHDDTYVYDFHFKYEKQREVYKCKLEYQLKNDSETTVIKVSLSDKEKTIFEQEVNRESPCVNFDMKGVKEWSAEIPNLYELYIEILNEGKTVEIIRQLVGFKRIKIDGDVFKFNDEPIKILGINHHDSNSKKGYAMGISDYLTHVKMMKEYNVNCVRTAHYPPDPILLTMCDIYGLYCIDEADIEAHGAQMTWQRPNLISNDLKWASHMLDRVKAMFERDKNHPSVTMWSLGNEAGGIKCQIECYKYLKTVTDIPVHYEPAFRFKIKNFDVYSRMYHTIHSMRKVAKKEGKKFIYGVPYFQCEYAHAMGVGPGGLNEYVKTFYEGEHILGGCIWEWIDHAVEHENGPYKYTYGGDHGEKKHDGNFCCDGLFFPDRTPTSGALCMKNVYRPITAKISRQEVEFFNRRYWQDSTDMKITVEVLVNGQAEEVFEYKEIIEPQKTNTLKVDLNKYKDSDCWVRISYSNLDGKLVASESHEVFERIKKVEGKRTAIANKDGVVASITAQNDGGFVAKGKDVVAKFRKNGDLFYYSHKGKVLIDKEINLSYEIWRAYIDNYMYMRILWQLLGYHKGLFKGTRAYVKDDSLIVLGNIRLFFQKVRVKIKYTINEEGAIEVSSVIKNKSIIPTDFPKMGVKFNLDKKYENVKYYGLGEGENYSDFHEQSTIGIFDQKTDDFYEPYIRPQDSGNRSKVRWFELTDAEGFGIKFEALGTPFNFKADRVDEVSVSKGRHREDVKQSDATNVYINGFVRGIGSQSCGNNDTEKIYRRHLTIGQSFESSFEITPIEGGGQK